ncbi:hypothetical protein [Kaistella polysaccharea]|uniref:hypothetical protein n=1 Tax=Kaistella polysaccharea TaxID=2878534 RepID=UPI001CF56DAE|nr:hypothetical protein [Kaistella polysaccharea]
MKIKISVVILLFSFTALMSQKFDKLIYSKKDKPTVIINEIIIANWELLNSIPSSKIKKMDVMKSKSNEADQYSAKYPNLSQYGLIVCTADVAQLESKTQNQIRTFFGTDPKTKIYVDGFLLVNNDFRIATKSIREIEMIKPNEEEFNTEMIINVWTLDKENRISSLTISKNEIIKDF